MTVQENLSDPWHHALTYPAWGLHYELNPLDVPHPFRDYVPAALAGLVLLTGLLALGGWRERRKESHPGSFQAERTSPGIGREHL